MESADNDQLQRALQPLKAQLTTTQRCQLPAERGTRTLLRLSPLKPCPRTYPRAVGIPSRQPLVDATQPMASNTAQAHLRLAGQALFQGSQDPWDRSRQGLNARASNS